MWFSDLIQKLKCLKSYKVVYEIAILKSSLVVNDKLNYIREPMVI